MLQEWLEELAEDEMKKTASSQFEEVLNQMEIPELRAFFDMNQELEKSAEPIDPRIQMAAMRGGAVGGGLEGMARGAMLGSGGGVAGALGGAALGGITGAGGGALGGRLQESEFAQQNPITGKYLVPGLLGGIGGVGGGMIGAGMERAQIAQEQKALEQQQAEQAASEQAAMQKGAEAKVKQAAYTGRALAKAGFIPAVLEPTFGKTAATDEEIQAAARRGGAVGTGLLSGLTGAAGGAVMGGMARGVPGALLGGLGGAALGGGLGAGMGALAGGQRYKDPGDKGVVAPYLLGGLPAIAGSDIAVERLKRQEAQKTAATDPELQAAAMRGGAIGAGGLGALAGGGSGALMGQELAGTKGALIGGLGGAALGGLGGALGGRLAGKKRYEDPEDKATVLPYMAGGLGGIVGSDIAAKRLMEQRALEEAQKTASVASKAKDLYTGAARAIGKHVGEGKKVTQHAKTIATDLAGTRGGREAADFAAAEAGKAAEETGKKVIKGVAGATGAAGTLAGSAALINKLKGKKEPEMASKTASFRDTIMKMAERGALPQHHGWEL